MFSDQRLHSLVSPMRVSCWTLDSLACSGPVFIFRNYTPKFILLLYLRFSLYPQKLAITSQTSDGRSVGVVRSRTQTMEFVFVFCFLFDVLTAVVMNVAI
jgi:hypothetical protein